MKALLWTAPNEAALVDQPEPVAGEGQSVVTVTHCGVCGSDLHGYRGHSPVRTPPLVLGHEVVGLAEGSPVIVNPIVGCGSCGRCREGRPNLCAARGLLGLDRPGAFAERVLVPTHNLVPLPAGLDPLVGALSEPLATPLNALRGVRVEGAVVVVFGCGPIGLLTAWAARKLGAATVITSDIDARRVEIARDVSDAAVTDAAEAIELARRASGGLGADIAIDAVGFEPTVRSAIGAVRLGGHVLVIGLGAAEANVQVGAIVRSGIELRGIYAYTPADFEAAVDMLAGEAPPTAWTGTEPLENGVVVLDALARGEDPRIKVVFTVA